MPSNPNDARTREEFLAAGGVPHEGIPLRLVPEDHAFAVGGNWCQKLPQTDIDCMKSWFNGFPFQVEILGSRKFSYLSARDIVRDYGPLHDILEAHAVRVEAEAAKPGNPDAELEREI